VNDVRRDADTVAVRQAGLADAEAIARIHIDAWRHNYRDLIDAATLDGLELAERLAYWRREFERGATVMVAERQARTLGWVSMGAFRHPPATRPQVVSLSTGWAELYGFYISPRAQRQGLGSALWHAARCRCLEQGYRHVGLWILADNQAARQFYQTCGFQDQQLDQNFDINGQPLVESLMARSLEH